MAGPSKSFCTGRDLERFESRAQLLQRGHVGSELRAASLRPSTITGTPQKAYIPSIYELNVMFPSLWECPVNTTYICTECLRFTKYFHIH